MKNPFDPRSEMIHLRFCRLMFGLRSSPAILGAVLARHLDSSKEYDPAIVELIKKSMYVDDFLSGSSNVSEGKELYTNSKKIMREASFNLRKWHSNSTELLEFIHNKETIMRNTTNTSLVDEGNVTEEDESYTKVTVGSNSQTKSKLVNVLGTSWDTETDQFQFTQRTNNTGKISSLEQEIVPTNICQDFRPIGYPDTLYHCSEMYFPIHVCRWTRLGRRTTRAVQKLVEFLCQRISTA